VFGISRASAVHLSQFIVMSQIELAVTLSRRLETLLEQKHKAVGKGLHEKVSSIEGNLSADLVKSLRYIATMRNSVVHQEGFVIDDQARFSAAGDAALAQLGGRLMNEPQASGATGAGSWVQDVKFYMSAAIVLAFAGAGASVCAMSFGTLFSGVVGLVGGAVLALWVLSVMQKVLEFLLGLVFIGCVIAVAGAIFKMA
jgi:hypothetical protein